MNRFEASTKLTKVAGTIIGGILGGLALAFFIYTGLERFSPLPASRSIQIALGGCAVFVVAMVLNLLFSTVKRVQVNDSAVRIQMLMGGDKVYPLQGSHFEPVIVHQTQQGRRVNTTRSLRIHGAGGQETHRLDIAPQEFSDLINLLTGSAVVPAGAAAYAGAPGMQPPPAVPRGPLAFQPRRFELQRNKALRRMTLPFGILGTIFLLGGLALLVFFISSDELEIGLIILAVLAFIGLLFLAVPFALKTRSRRIPRSVLVGPVSVSFDQQTFAYTDLQVLQIKAPGAQFERSAKILTGNGEKVVIPLGLDHYHKMFPEYDEFATLLNEAGTAAAGVVRLDHS